ncbi:MAG: protein kinase [Gemmatimonadetes bacterium]|nr:protein kinase [Gemmatimonadota bacterium]
MTGHASAAAQAPVAHPPILDDQAADRDLLGFGAYADALTAMLMQPKTRTPITVGIYGRWGTGKTTLMRMVERNLRRAGVLPIWFNAWQYSREDELWSAFLQSVLNGIYRETDRRLIRFNIRLLRRRMNWERLFADAPALLLRSAAWIIPAALALGLRPFAEYGFAIAALSYGSGTFAAVALLAWSVYPLAKRIRATTSIDLSAVVKSASYRDRIGFLDQFRDHFADVVASLDGADGKKLAVIIDDLDRCMPERTLQVLDAINLFLDVPGTVYVVGLDTEVVSRALAEKYKGDETAQREYLSKIVQIPFQLPPLTRDTMSEFIEQTLVAWPDERCRSVFVHGLRANPRELKRTINTFSLLWYLVQQREDLRAVISPVRMAKLVVLQHSFPRLYELVSERPELLIALEVFFWSLSRPAVATVEARAPLPPALEAFGRDVELQRVMMLHVDEGIRPGDPMYGGFRGLSDDLLRAYFTFSRRTVAEPSPASESGPSTLIVFPQSGLDDFRIINEIGRGGMATVFLGEKVSTHERVAIKVLDERQFASASTAARFREEIAMIREFRHQNIVAYVGEGELRDPPFGRPFFAMELLEGGTLGQTLRTRGRIGWKQAREIMLPILSALEYIHDRGVVHRDVKPDSIGFDARGTPKLMDFGIGRRTQRESVAITQTGAIIGTPNYMSPEVFLGRESGFASDIFGIGVILHECIAGQRPFGGDDVYAVMREIVESEPAPLSASAPDAPASLQAIVARCLRKDPADRFQSAKELAQALAEVAA